MHTRGPTNRPPKAIVIPNNRADTLRYVSGAKQHSWTVSTYLTAALYPVDNVMPPLDKPKWVHDPYPKIPLSTSVFVRRFNENMEVWGPWIEGTTVAESTTRRPLGPVRSYWVEYDNEYGHQREEFVPYIGEVWYPDRVVPSDMLVDYYVRRRELNLVYIPIMTNVARLRDGISDNFIVFYVGQAMYTNEECSEWHVRVLNGPYAGQYMNSTQVYSFTPDNARTIQSAPERGEYVFDYLSNAQCYPVELEESYDDVMRRPRGIGSWEITPDIMQYLQDPYLDQVREC
ncbi:hypothetical protein B0H21DRAFT_585541 [Amylocystis lapponica]|nr:hypothetical protein B0H21DRAFT_585541 [Amylocystis lapponica]